MIFPYIEPYLDPSQCGGLKRSSISHYLVKLLHFVHKNLDKKQPYAVLLALFDLEKAFNHVSHVLVIEDLADMNVQCWLLAILISYLSGRCMHMRYNGATSTKRSLPGSTPQGAFLGISLFIIIFNGTLLRPTIPRQESFHLKYIDDLSLLFAVNLSCDLVEDPEMRPRPLQFSERTGYVLNSNSLIQEKLLEVHEFTSSKLMKIKEAKTQVMKFNFSHTLDFPPELHIPGFTENLAVIDQTKLLGVIISSDLKWEANTAYICAKALKRLWILGRLKSLSIPPSFILDVYTKEIRSILELAIPAWHSGLTKKQTNEIEHIQKTALAIILGKPLPYHEALTFCNLEPLSERREKLCRKFAKNTLKSKHSDIFKTCQTKNTYNIRFKPKFFENFCNTKRFYQSPVNYLTRILNSH